MQMVATSAKNYQEILLSGKKLIIWKYPTDIQEAKQLFLMIFILDE